MSILLILSGYIIFNLRQNVNKVYPSVVHIECKNKATTTIGSGIVFDTKFGKHYIVTNYHVIKGYVNINIYDEKLNKEKATILNYDEEKDIAVLSIDSNLKVKKATFDINRKLINDEKVYILTSFIGSDKSYISKDATVKEADKKLKVNNTELSTIELKYDIEKGDSGSPLIDKNGKVIGMIFLKDKSKDNVGYALPISFIFENIENLDKKQENINLGAAMTSSTNKELLEEYDINVLKDGVVILSLKKDYPLFNAGLKKGDLIVKFNGANIKNIADLKNEIKKVKKNHTVKIEYYRNDKKVKTNIKLNK